MAAIAALHGARLDGSTANLTVKFAETEKEKQAKRLIASQTAAFPYAPAPAQVGIGHHMPMARFLLFFCSSVCFVNRFLSYFGCSALLHRRTRT